MRQQWRITKPRTARKIGQINWAGLLDVAVYFGGFLRNFMGGTINFCEKSESHKNPKRASFSGRGLKVSCR
jgi:hypothetical protein